MIRYRDWIANEGQTFAKNERQKVLQEARRKNIPPESLGSVEAKYKEIWAGSRVSLVTIVQSFP